ncbi:unnamed protein product, partial [Vitis vinifera]
MLRVFVEKFNLCMIDLLYVWIYGFQVKESIFDSGVLVFRPCDAQFVKLSNHSHLGSKIRFQKTVKKFLIKVSCMQV